MLPLPRLDGLVCYPVIYVDIITDMLARGTIAFASGERCTIDLQTPGVCKSMVVPRRHTCVDTNVITDVLIRFIL